MPCRSDYPDESLVSKVDHDRVVRLLCAATNHIFTKGTTPDDVMAELREWHKQHSVLDRRRKKAEQEEKNREKRILRALGKLTPKEREELRKYHREDDQYDEEDEFAGEREEEERILRVARTMRRLRENQRIREKSKKKKKPTSRKKRRT